MLFFARLDRRLQFLPLGVLWGIVAGVLQVYNFALVFAEGGVKSVDWTIILSDLKDWVLIGPGVGACLIAIVVGSAMLKRELTPTMWVANWVTTAVASCVGGVMIHIVALNLWHSSEGSLSSVFDSVVGAEPETIVLLFIYSAAFGLPIAVEAAVVALLLAPVSLLGRRLILRRNSSTEPGGHSTQAQS